MLFDYLWLESKERGVPNGKEASVEEVQVNLTTKNPGNVLKPAA